MSPVVEDRVKGLVRDRDPRLPDAPREICLTKGILTTVEELVPHRQSPAVRNAIITHLSPELVPHTLHELKRRYGLAPSPELHQNTLLAMDALIQSFNGRGSLIGYLKSLLLFRTIDYLRVDGTFHRSQIENHERLQRAEERLAVERRPSEDLCFILGVSPKQTEILQRAQRLSSPQSLDQRNPSSDFHFTEDLVAPLPTPGLSGNSRRAIYRKLHFLGATERFVLMAHVLEGHNLSEIAEELGVSPTTVHKYLRNARIRCQAALPEDLADEQATFTELKIDPSELSAGLLTVRKLVQKRGLPDILCEISEYVEVPNFIREMLTRTDPATARLREALTEAADSIPALYRFVSCQYELTTGIELTYPTIDSIESSGILASLINASSPALEELQ